MRDTKRGACTWREYHASTSLRAQGLAQIGQCSSSVKCAPQSLSAARYPLTPCLTIFWLTPTAPSEAGLESLICRALTGSDCVPDLPVLRMKQAIQERFILDVLSHYTPVKSYYKLIKKVEDDPEFDVKKAQKKLRRFVEGHQHAIRLKAEMMVDHFHMKNSDKQNARIRTRQGARSRDDSADSGRYRAI